MVGGSGCGYCSLVVTRCIPSHGVLVRDSYWSGGFFLGGFFCSLSVAWVRSDEVTMKKMDEVLAGW
jgi:hypothetical protein